MRLFVAVALPPRVQADLADAVSDVRAGHPLLRWVAPERWHLTLTFLGEVPDAVVPRLQERLVRAAGRYDPIPLQVAGAGRFGKQVLWAGLAGDVASLQRLAASTSAAGRRCGIPVEDRPYRPHLTLARARPPADLRAAAEALSGYTGPQWTAGDVRLVRSTRGAEPVYTELLQAPLGGRSPT